MPSIQVNRLTNANIYVNGVSKLGTAEEITAPDIKFMLAEHKALGMVGKVELFSGIDKLEMKIKWNSFYADVMAQFSNPFNALQLQIRSSLETYTSQGRSAEVPVVVYVTGMIKNVPMGNFKQHDNVELESTLTATYVKFQVNGVEVMEFDALANIYKVNGVDVLLNYRNNIGG